VKGDLAEGFLFTQLIATKSGVTLIYYDHSEGDLKMAAEAAGTFTVTTLDGGDPSTDRGQFCSADAAAPGSAETASIPAVSRTLRRGSVATNLHLPTGSVLPLPSRGEGRGEG